MERQQWLSIEETAAALKVGIPTVESLINRGLLETQSGSEPPVISYDAVLEFMRQNQRTTIGDEQLPPDLGISSGTHES
jgi:hypothetical protein